jgi:hypothetical protein
MGDSEASVASARELYDREPTFRAGITAWVEERRCDLRLVDLLLEYGLTTQAECARWAATEPARRFPDDRRRKCGPFPCDYKGISYWFSRSGPLRDSHDVPRVRLPRSVHYGTDQFTSAADAILFLLDIWKPKGTGSSVGKRRRKK